MAQTHFPWTDFDSIFHGASNNFKPTAKIPTTSFIFRWVTVVTDRQTDINTSTTLFITQIYACVCMYICMYARTRTHIFRLGEDGYVECWMSIWSVSSAIFIIFWFMEEDIAYKLLHIKNGADFLRYMVKLGWLFQRLKWLLIHTRFHTHIKITLGIYWNTDCKWPSNTKVCFDTYWEQVKTHLLKFKRKYFSE